MDSKENSSSVSNKADERRKMLEEYLQAKKAKKSGKQPVQATEVNVKDSQTATTPSEEFQVEKSHPEIGSTEITKVDPANSLNVEESTVTPKSDPAPVETCTISTVGPIIIDWSKPVYLKTISGLVRVQRPHLRLFRFSQVEAAINTGLDLLAKIMLQVLGAPRQCKRFDARFCGRFWKLYKGLHAGKELSEIKNAATDFLLKDVLDDLFPEVCPSSTPKKPSLSEPSTPNTPVTPEITLPAPNVLQTPEDDEETRRMQAEIDQVVRRTPQIQKITPPRPIVLQRALTAIKDTSLYRTAPVTGKVDGNLADKGGSAYLYAMITPSKKMREMLETNSAVSPVRRSKRLISLHSPNKNLYSRLDEIPNLAECGFIPNNAVNDCEISDQRRLAVKQDHNSTHGTPSKKRSKTEAKEDETQLNPFE
ncbi:hypothetical protein PSACC_00732 [Paramicrosporidium saccamoebae]|uniref:Uncharacterized protein n=1 Tax=Paramicrosporidium saccamoebae TaxID=1246581 RepID=A0A2H9TNY5_9FUNG|nr:hypothetical protein PSACC_00732 [Paramicrosporidium saccamoebae]